MTTTITMVTTATGIAATTTAASQEYVTKMLKTAGSLRRRTDGAEQQMSSRIALHPKLEPICKLPASPSQLEEPCVVALKPEEAKLCTTFGPGSWR